MVNIQKKKKTHKFLTKLLHISMKHFEVASDPKVIKKRERIREEAGNDKDTSTVYMNTNTEVNEGKTYLLVLHSVEPLDRYELVVYSEMTRKIDLPQE